MPRSKKQTLRPANLTELYNQLQAVMPVLAEIVQPACAKPARRLSEDRSEEVREATQPYTPSLILADFTGFRYYFEKRGKESWAVLDRFDGDALLALTKYKKGAETLIERLEAYEQRIAELSRTSPHPLSVAA
jgi:hypothetical protein